MTKADFVAAVAEKSGLTKVDASKATSAFIDVVKEIMKEGDKVTFPGFGSFSVAARVARKGRNIHTGEEIQIPASKSGKFSAAKELRGL